MTRGPQVGDRPAGSGSSRAQNSRPAIKVAKDAVTEAFGAASTERFNRTTQSSRRHRSELTGYVVGRPTAAVDPALEDAPASRYH